MMKYVSLPLFPEATVNARPCGCGIDSASSENRRIHLRKGCTTGFVAAGLFAAGLVSFVVFFQFRPKTQIATITKLLEFVDNKKNKACHTAIPGESCYRNVHWHMTKGIISNPEWYPGLNKNSDFDLFQGWVHEESANICPLPCPPGQHKLAAAVKSQDMIGTESCHTAIKGEKCYKKVTWAMEDGIYSNPEWYKGLSQTSSFEQFQSLMNELFPATCPTPCKPVAPKTTTAKPTHKKAKCHIAVKGEHCHDNVEWAMTKGLKRHPDWYDGLSETSTFEEFQTVLHNSHDAGCEKPCECHTAIPGEHCYNSVQWALTSGISKHPSWYKGLSATSRFEDVQSRLHQDTNTSCPLPCTPVKSNPSALFCFVVARASGYEPELVRHQQRLGLGIFACDDHAVFSAQPLPNGIQTIIFKKAYVGISESGTAANAQLFMNVWDAVRKDLRYKRHGWIIKVDPDSVMLPDRLRHHLTPYSGGSTYIKNCNKYGPNMFGVLEALSLIGLETYYAGRDRCKKELHWQPWGEDKFMEMCLDHLAVKPVNDFDMVDDANCKVHPIDCLNKQAAAFHPFKSINTWSDCWRKAGR